MVGLFRRQVASSRVNSNSFEADEPCLDFENADTKTMMVFFLCVSAGCMSREDHFLVADCGTCPKEGVSGAWI